MPLRAPRQQSAAVLAWLRLMRVHQKIQHAAVVELRRAGLTLGQFDVLAQVGASEGASQQEVADALLVTKSNVCQLLDRMEAAGLVARQHHGREKHIYLTPVGRALHDRVVPAHEQRIAEQLAALSPEEQGQLLGLLRTLDHSLS